MIPATETGLTGRQEWSSEQFNCHAEHLLAFRRMAQPVLAAGGFDYQRLPRAGTEPSIPPFSLSPSILSFSLAEVCSSAFPSSSASLPDYRCLAVLQPRQCHAPVTSDRRPTFGPFLHGSHWALSFRRLRFSWCHSCHSAHRVSLHGPVR